MPDIIEKDMDKKFLTLVKDSVCQNWNQPALTNLGSSTYLYSDFAKEIAKMHILFEELGVKKGDKVALCDKNSANWAIAFFSTLCYGAVATSILSDFDPTSIENIVTHSDAKVLFIGKHNLANIKLDNMPAAEHIIQMDDFVIFKSTNEKVLRADFNLDEVFNLKYPNGYSKEDVKYHDESPEELAILNYTSGTTSAPKGVMLPYRSLWSNTEFAIVSIPFVKNGDNMICMLPMAHMYGLAFEVLLSITKGCHLHFLSRPPSPQVILSAFAETNPSLVVTVPLIIEKIIQNNVFPQLAKFPTSLLIKLPIIKNSIYKKVADKIKPLFGKNLEELVIGGAALNQEVGAFLSKIKFPYTVGYGMTECGPLVAYAYWADYKVSSCGKAVARMEIKIDSTNPATEAGEILLKGDNVMLGYYKNEDLTKNTFTEDGWLKTGDLGVIDSDGFLFIKGRSKTMILGPSGQNIYPEEIEGFYNNSPYIAESLIIEENHKLIALIYPDKDYMTAQNIHEEDYSKILDEEVKAINKRLPKFSKVVNFRIQKEEFEKTPKRSIKRFLYQK